MANTTYTPQRAMQVDSLRGGGMMPMILPPDLSSLLPRTSGGFGMKGPSGGSDLTKAFGSAGIKPNRQKTPIYGRYMSAPNSLGGGYLRLNQFEPGATVVGYE